MSLMHLKSAKLSPPKDNHKKEKVYHLPEDVKPSRKKEMNYQHRNSFSHLPLKYQQGKAPKTERTEENVNLDKSNELKESQVVDESLRIVKARIRELEIKRVYKQKVKQPATTRTMTKNNKSKSP